MARRRSRSYDYSYEYYDPDPLADPLLNLVTRAVIPSPVRALEKVTRQIRRDALVSLARLEDNRVWNPEPRVLRRARATRRDAADLIPGPLTRSVVAPSAGLSFRDPSRVSVCAKRQIRREVIFAKTGGGGGPRKRPRRTAFSNVSC